MTKNKGRFTKICKCCGHKENTGQDEYCKACYEPLSEETPVTETAYVREEAPSSESPNLNEVEPASASGNKCPECNFALDESLVCVRCKGAQDYRLNWQDTKLGKTYITRERPVFIGRVPPVDPEMACHIEAAFPFVSRIHAEIFLDPEGCLYVRDLNSRNGTYVNSQRIDAFAAKALQPGDTLSFSSQLKAIVEQL